MIHTISWPFFLLELMDDLLVWMLYCMLVSKEFILWITEGFIIPVSSNHKCFPNPQFETAVYISEIFNIENNWSSKYLWKLCSVYVLDRSRPQNCVMWSLYKGGCPRSRSLFQYCTVLHFLPSIYSIIKGFEGSYCLALKTCMHLTRYIATRLLSYVRIL